MESGLFVVEIRADIIYDIMKMGGVSYGEAQRVISSFRNRNLLKQNGNFVSVLDLKPILNEVF